VLLGTRSAHQSRHWAIDRSTGGRLET
jgi:hypothetical protein